MADEASTLTSTSKMAEDEPAPNQSETTNEGTIQSNAQGEHSESSLINLESSEISAVNDHEKSLEFADELMEKGSLTFKEGDFPDAAELFSRALEIRVAHYGELAPECIKSYYKFGLALLYKAQEEADPLGSMPKKDAESQEGSKIESSKKPVERESSLASVSSNAEQCASSSQPASSSQQQGADDVPSKDEGDEDDESDTDEVNDAEEDESDLDLAWKMLDLARAISEKQSKETMDMVDILSALAEVSLESEDIETSLSDYQKALAILESLVEPDNRYIAELNFRICLCLEVGSRSQEAIPYCEKAISVCKSRMQRLLDELTRTPDAAEDAAADKQAKKAEIGTLKSLSSDLEKKLEDLQQLVSNPTSILSDILGLAAAKARANEQASASAPASSSRVGVATSNGDFDSPTVSSAHTNGAASGVTHLGVVGRGVKRVNMNSANVESDSSKRPAIDPKPDTGDSSAA
ncbi:histone-binding protein N1/N2-like [Chenopodium quinoa]|uniref:histone-binding protein N1/N2-like n=1 Tax=Chenopodium quinoa TaxID=63459 RepID=UPI000B77EC63|nr:histone-binding protein N1/N2-like [Chenopodium quinoa]